MKKRLISFFLLITIICVAFVGCKDTGKEIFHTVSFDTSGGSEIPSQTVEDGQKAQLPDRPTRSGYTFGGWLYNGVAFSFDTPITADITLTAFWRSELTLDSLRDLWRGTGVLDGKEYTYNLDIKTGGAGALSYTLDGEVTELRVGGVAIRNDRVVVSIVSTPATELSFSYADGKLSGEGIFGESLTLERQKTVSVTYHYYGGGESTERYIKGDPFVSLYCPTPKNFVFDGWYTSDGVKINEGEPITEQTHLYASAHTAGLISEGESIVGYEGDATEITLPSYMNGYRITTIGKDAFLGKEITDVSFAEGLLSIGDGAFRGCTELLELRLPKTVESLGSYAFFDCVSLAEINLPDSLKSIGLGCFGSTLTLADLGEEHSIVVPDNTSLKSISLPFIGGGEAGEECGFLAFIFGAVSPDENWADDAGREIIFNGESVTVSMYYNIPVTLEKITVRGDASVPDKAFYNCMYVEKITLEGLVSEIGESAFEGCFSAVISGLSTVERIDDKAFANTKFSGEAMYMLEYIGDFAFAYTPITSFYFSDSLTHIGDYAFMFTELSEVTFPTSLEYLGSGAFHACPNLSLATFLGSETPQIGADVFTIIGDDGLTYYTDISVWVPGTAKVGEPFENYRSSLYFRDYASGIFPISVKGQTGYIVEGDRLIGYISPDGEDLNVLEIPNGVRVLTDFAFYNCGFIEEVKMPEGFEIIGDYAFYGCTSVAYLYASSTLLEIGDYAFTGFFVGNNISRLYLPEGLRRIGEGAFMSSFNLRILEIPSTVEYIGYLAFGMANSLEIVYFKGGTPPTVGTYTNDKGEVSCELFEIINKSNLTVYTPSGKIGGVNVSDIYKSADGFGLVADFIKARPEGAEVGHYGDGELFVELDGCDKITVSRLVLAENDTSGMGGTKYIYESFVGSYVITGETLVAQVDGFGRIRATFKNRTLSFTSGGISYTLSEPKHYYDDYMWANFKLYESGKGVFDMYGSFITPFIWEIDGDAFRITIDGNNKLEENSAHFGPIEYTGSYDKSTDSFSVSLMLNDYMNDYSASVTSIVYPSGEQINLYGKYVAYQDNGATLMTIVSYGNGILDFYIGTALYEDCAYTVEGGVVSISIFQFKVNLTLDSNGMLYGGEELAGMDMTFIYEDELMDSTRMPD